jgi:hypothetical protein
MGKNNEDYTFSADETISRFKAKAGLRGNVTNRQLNQAFGEYIVDYWARHGFHDVKYILCAKDGYVRTNLIAGLPPSEYKRRKELQNN